MFLNADVRLTETGLISRVQQAVPDGGSGDWEDPAADGRQFHGRHQQTIGPSRAEGTSTRQIGDTNQLTQDDEDASCSACKRDTACVCCSAPCCGAAAAGRRRPPLSIDVSYPHGAQQQTRRTPLLRSNDRTDRQTDRFIDSAAHTMRAV